MRLAHLPFDQFFGDEALAPSYIKRARLRKHNRFDLPAGEYILHDLYATEPTRLAQLYFIVEHVSSGTPLLTASFQLDGDPPELVVSPRHLQSELAPEALGWAMCVIDTQQTYELVMARYEKLMRSFAQRLHDSMPPEVQQQVKAWSPGAAAEKGVLIPFPAPSGGLQLRIDLVEAPLPIWRELTVPASLSLGQLHEVIQTVMGWDNAHRWQFQARDQVYTDEACSQVRLVELLKRKGSKLNYVYDFEDPWLHEISLQARLPQKSELRLLDGKNACPPEDCGGAFGYSEILRIIAKKRKNAADREVMALLGAGFDPHQAGLPAARKALKRLAQHLS